MASPQAGIHGVSGSLRRIAEPVVLVADA